MTGRQTASHDDGWKRLLRLVSIELLALIGAASVVVMFVDSIRRNLVAVDLWQFYVAAEAILGGDNPYALTSTDPRALWGGVYPYPPFPAFLVTPLTVLSLQSAGLLLMAILVCVALAVPYVLGIRDWRCYGLLLVWPSTMQAVQTGNVTLWFALAAAIAWRLRNSRLPPAASIGATLATKYYLWPLVVWLAATRRAATAALSVAIGVLLLLVSWAVIGFAGLTEYPALLRRFEGAAKSNSYTTYVVGVDLGLPSPLARALWLGLGVGLLVLLVALARRGDELSGFIVAIAASLALTPVVWLHYFALFLVVIALAQPRLGLLWFLPLGLFLTPGDGHPTRFEAAWTIALASAIVVLSLRSTLAQSRESAVGGRAELALEDA